MNIHPAPQLKDTCLLLQYDAQTDTRLRAAIAEALNNYCNVNATRRTECRLTV